MKNVKEGIQKVQNVTDERNQKTNFNVHINSSNLKGNNGITKIFRILQGIKLFATIRFKLIAAFLVPIAFIIILGFVSFRKASEAIVNNYEIATTRTIEMAGEYIGFGLNSVEATSVQYTNDDFIYKYFIEMYENDATESNRVRQSIKNNLSAKKVTDVFIEDIFLISDTVASITTSNSTFESGIYKSFAATELGSYLKDNRTEMVWVGEDACLDEKFGTTSSNYALRLIRHITGKEALLVIDIKMPAVNDALAGLNFDASGFLSFVTADGKEVSPITYEENVFSNQDFYKNAVESEETSGSEYVNFKSQEYLFMYSKVGESGAVICALMPKEVITSRADSIKVVTILIVIIACIVAVLIGVMISNGIDKTIKMIIAGLKKAAQGDLTVEFTSKRNDEFHILNEEIRTTFINMKELIQQVKTLSGEVSASSENVSRTSEEFLKSTEDISTAMYEIEQGVSQQAKDAEECLTQMDSLSKKIKLVSDNTKEISQIADHAKQSIKEGTVVTEDLNQQTKSTIEITTCIISEIEQLAEKSSSISKIINVINEIANQTNLLSLNASIEAARAGEYGRGFAVVASEIRNLAEQSKNSVNDIKKLIGSIQDDTKSAVDIAKKAENVLLLQESAVKNTTDSYQNINESVEKLMVFLNFIAENVNNIEEARISTLGAVENISAVMEEIAASTNTVNQTSNDQLSSVETLNKSAGKLNENAEVLVQEVQKFKVD